VCKVVISAFGTCAFCVDLTNNVNSGREQFAPRLTIYALSAIAMMSPILTGEPMIEFTTRRSDGPRLSRPPSISKKLIAIQKRSSDQAEGALTCFPPPEHCISLDAPRIRDQPINHTPLNGDCDMVTQGVTSTSDPLTDIETAHSKLRVLLNGDNVVSKGDVEDQFGTRFRSMGGCSSLSLPTIPTTAIEHKA
jgi:hypothetical protein